MVAVAWGAAPSYAINVSGDWTLSATTTTSTCPHPEDDLGTVVLEFPVLQLGDDFGGEFVDADNVLYTVTGTITDNHVEMTVEDGTAFTATGTAIDSAGLFITGTFVGRRNELFPDGNFHVCFVSGYFAVAVGAIPDETTISGLLEAGRRRALDIVARATGDMDAVVEIRLPEFSETETHAQRAQLAASIRKDLFEVREEAAAEIRQDERATLDAARDLDSSFRRDNPTDVVRYNIAVRDTFPTLRFESQVQAQVVDLAGLIGDRKKDLEKTVTDQKATVDKELTNPELPADLTPAQKEAAIAGKKAAIKEALDALKKLIDETLDGAVARYQEIEERANEALNAKFPPGPADSKEQKDREAAQKALLDDLEKKKEEMAKAGQSIAVEMIEQIKTRTGVTIEKTGKDKVQPGCFLYVRVDMINTGIVKKCAGAAGGDQLREPGKKEFLQINVIVAGSDPDITVKVEPVDAGLAIKGPNNTFRSASALVFGEKDKGFTEVVKTKAARISKCDFFDFTLAPASVQENETVRRIALPVIGNATDSCVPTKTKVSGAGFGWYPKMEKLGRTGPDSDIAFIYPELPKQLEDATNDIKGKK